MSRGSGTWIAQAQTDDREDKHDFDHFACYEVKCIDDHSRVRECDTTEEKVMLFNQFTGGKDKQARKNRLMVRGRDGLDRFSNFNKARAVASGASYRPLIDPPPEQAVGSRLRHRRTLSIIESYGGVCKSLSTQAERNFFGWRCLPYAPEKGGGGGLLPLSQGRHR
jgi:hypothetical protein